MNNDNLKAYPTDLTEWTLIAPLFNGMRKYKYSKRELLNAVLYLGTTVANGEHYHTNFQLGRLFTVFFAVLKNLRILQHLEARRRAGRNPNPTYAIIDSQSVDTAYKSEQVCFDGGKKTLVTNDISFVLDKAISRLLLLMFKLFWLYHVVTLGRCNVGLWNALLLGSPILADLLKILKKLRGYD